MSAQITVNEPRTLGVSLMSLQLGDYFRFQSSALGAAYVVIEFCYNQRGWSFTSVLYQKLDNGAQYQSSADKDTRVVRLTLMSATLEVQS